MACRTVEGHSVDALDHFAMRWTDTEHESVVARRLHRQRLVGEHQRMAGIGRDDGGTQLEIDARPSDQRQSDHGIELVRLSEPQRRKSGALRPLRGVDQGIEHIGALAQGRTQLQTYPHAPPYPDYSSRRSGPVSADRKLRPTEEHMEFGIFTNMYHPKHWRDGKVRSEHQ